MQPSASPLYAARCVGWSAPQTTVGAGTAGVAVVLDPAEGGEIGRLVISSPDGGDELALSDWRHDNVRLMTGVIPIEIFAHDSVVNPRFRRVVHTRSKLTFEADNDDGVNARDINIGYIAARRLADGSKMSAEIEARLGRNLLVYGGDSQQDIAGGGGSYQFTFQIDQPGRLGHLVLGETAIIEELLVSELTVNNDPLLSIDTDGVPAAMFAADNPDNPLLGHMVDTNDDVTCTVVAAGATGTTGLALGITTI